MGPPQFWINICYVRRTTPLCLCGRVWAGMLPMVGTVSLQTQPSTSDLQPTVDLSASKQQSAPGYAAWGAEHLGKHLAATKTQKIPVPSKGFPI